MNRLYNKRAYLSLPSILSFFIIFLLLSSPFLVINTKAKSDTHIEFAGGVTSLQFTSNEHIVMNENGNEMGVAFIGVDGDASTVNFLYRDLPSCSWCTKAIRVTTNATPQVAITQDSDFNIHAIWKEQNTTNYNLYYKVFDWSEKEWYDEIGGNLAPSDDLGVTISNTALSVNLGDIKVGLNDDVHIVYCERTGQGGPYSENLYTRYDASDGYFDLILSLDAETTNNYLYKYHSLALDSESNIYCTYAKRQTEHWHEDYNDVYYVKSTNGGTSWSVPSQIINMTYPLTVIPKKLIIDNDNALHFIATYNNSDSWNKYSAYYNSFDYGNTWTNVIDITDNSVDVSHTTLTKDADDILYFTYDYRTNPNASGDTVELYGKKYEDSVLSDEILITDDDNRDWYLNLVFSNIYNQYANSGIIGIYEDRSLANFDIRYLEMDRSDFITSPYSVSISPSKDIYYIYDTVTFTVVNPTDDGAVCRVIDADGNKVIPQSEWLYADCIYRNSQSRITYMLPVGTVGTWQVQVTPSNIACDEYNFSVDETYNYNFTVALSNLTYWISAFPSWVLSDNWVSCQFSAKANEQYRIEVVSSYGETRGNFTTIRYEVDQNVTIEFLYLCEYLGSFYLILHNYTDDSILGISNIFRVSDYPEENTYSVDVDARYSYLTRPVIKIYRYGVQEYRIFIYNGEGIAIFSGTFDTNSRVIQLLLTDGDIGTATIQVFDVDGFPSDLNAINVNFEIYNPSDTTGDPVIDTFIIIPEWAKGIVGVIITLAFVFMPFILAFYFKLENMEIPPVIYAVCGGLGAVLSTIFGLWGWEVAFFICVISAISLVISYVWQQQKGG